MIRLPLFGKDSSPHRTSLIIAIIATIVLWVIMLVSCIFINPNNDKEEFEVVRIILDSTPVEEEPAPQPEVQGEAQANTTSEVQPEVQEQNQQLVSEEPPAPVIEEPAPEPVQEQKPVQEPVKEPEPTPAPVVETPKPKPEPKQEPKPEQKKPEPKPEQKKPEPKPEQKKEQEQKNEQKKQETKQEPVIEKNTTPDEKKYNPPEYSKSMDDLIDEAFNGNNKREYTDDDFDRYFNESSFKSNESKTDNKVTVNKKNELSKSSVGAVDNPDDNGRRKSVNNNKKEDEKESSDIGARLDAVTSAGETNYNNNNKKSNDNQNGGDDKDFFSKGLLKDGRKITYPNPPFIKLEKSKGLIKEEMEVIIKFSVLDNGHIPLNSIKFEPESLLPKPVKDEICEQIIKTWIFEEADKTSNVRVKHIIVIQ